MLLRQKYILFAKNCKCVKTSTPKIYLINPDLYSRPLNLKFIIHIFPKRASPPLIRICNQDNAVNKYNHQ
jgi:hypothetical protein